VGALVIFSTIPIGGHYVVDLVAGAGVFALWSWFTRTRPAGASILGQLARPAGLWANA
jgi:membrane-associated phospholipid phosphatase